MGTLRLDLTKEQVADTREKELRAANKIIGVKETIILDYPDAGFINGPELREKLVFFVRKLKADRVVTFDPWVSYEVHPDHVIVGRMAAEAAAFAAFPLLYPEQIKNGVEPYACSEVWFMGLLGHKPNYFVDITSTLEKKIDADYAPKRQAVGKQLKFASNRGAKFVVLLGQETLSQNMITLKDLTSGRQWKIHLDAFLQNPSEVAKPHET